MGDQTDKQALLARIAAQDEQIADQAETIRQAQAAIRVLCELIARVPGGFWREKLLRP